MNGDKPPGAVKNITQVLGEQGQVLSEKEINIPCPHTAPDVVASDVVAAVQKVATKYTKLAGK